MSNERVKTDIRGFDEMVMGGFLPQTANLVEGPPGTGKSTFGMQFIYNGIQHHNEPGLIVPFEEFPQQYLLDLSYSFPGPTWFITPYTRLGVRGKYRVLDQYSNRYLPSPERPGREGYEWEMMTYVHFTLL